MSSFEDASEAYGLVLTETPTDVEVIAAVRCASVTSTSICARPRRPSWYRSCPRREARGLGGRARDAAHDGDRAERPRYDLPSNRCGRRQELQELANRQVTLRALAEEPGVADLHAEIERLAEGEQRVDPACGCTR